MNSSKSVEYFQQEQLNIDDNNTLPSIDMNYLFLNRGIKYILNFLLIYMFVTSIIYNFQEINIHVFIILICTISSIVFYILDLNFPSCYI
jgi:inner membrane protein involved in colicin E2 resistance